jgi:hypothetical protein
MTNPVERLENAAKQVDIAREKTDRPDQDAALARAEYLLRGVADAIDEDDPDDIDSSFVADGGRKLPLPTQETDRTLGARKDLQQTHLSRGGWSR